MGLFFLDNHLNKLIILNVIDILYYSDRVRINGRTGLLYRTANWEVNKLINYDYDNSGLTLLRRYKNSVLLM